MLRTFRVSKRRLAARGAIGGVLLLLGVAIGGGGQTTGPQTAVAESAPAVTATTTATTTTTVTATMTTTAPAPPPVTRTVTRTVTATVEAAEPAVTRTTPSAPDPADVDVAPDAAAGFADVGPDDTQAEEADAPSGPFGNCSQARAAGAAPLNRGDLGYSTKLDRDGDGVACE